MSLSTPNNTSFSVSFTFTAIRHYSVSIISSEFQKRLTQTQLPKISSILSLLSLQTSHWISEATPISFNIMFVAIIICTMRICSHKNMIPGLTWCGVWLWVRVCVCVCVCLWVPRKRFPRHYWSISIKLGTATASDMGMYNVLIISTLTFR